MTPRKVLVTGGAGFIGSHVAEHWRAKGAEVVVLDNLSRAETLPTASRERAHVEHNWRHLEGLGGVKMIRGDVRDARVVEEAARGADLIVHAAAQVAVTTAVANPRLDHEVNVLGSFNALEAARRNDVKTVVYCSTNKVYGENVNEIPVRATGSRYEFSDPRFALGIPESLTIDHCEHTPYGVSKLAGDLYAQDYGRLYGIRTGVFRMSCIYGTRQFGNEDQGWVAHFVLNTLRGKPLSIYGDGKQVRDALFVKDLVAAYDAFVSSGLAHGVWNMGGGPRYTTSLLELVDLLAKLTGKRSPLSYGPWRPSDQRVYVSDVRKAEKDLGWSPKTDVETGIRAFIDWYERTPDAK